MSDLLDTATLLPHGGRLPVRHLSRVFGKRNSAYKFCLVKALLTLTCEGKRLEQVTLEELRREMLAVAWIPRLVYRLKFGKIDKLGLILDELGKHCAREGIRTEHNLDEMRKLVRRFEPMMDDPAWPLSKQYRNLIRFAPYRLLTPWFEAQLRGLPDVRKNGLIAELSNAYFEKSLPLYRIRSQRGGSRLVMHMAPEWLAYLRENYLVILGWLNMEWLRYLEPLNSGVPNLVDKLWAYQGRRSPLTIQRNFWQPVLAEGFACIYSGKRVDPRDFALDHFLPWSCVAHDRLWNLVPTTPEVNSSKSDRLPQERHVAQSAAAHVQAIKRNLPLRRSGDTCLGEYVDWLDVGISPKSFDETRFRRLYVEKMSVQLHNAQWLGFENMNGVGGA